MHEIASRQGHEQGTEMGAWIDAAPVAMLVVRHTGGIVVANRAACAMFGYPVDQLVALHIDDLMPEAFRARHHEHVARFFQVMTSRTMGVGRTVLAVNSAGREFPVEIGLSVAATASGMCVIAAIIDITERSRRDRESRLARMVQEAMLPQMPDDLEGIAIAAKSEPAEATGGDFYDLIRLPNERIGIVIGDASGHGFAAALVTANARSYVRALARTESDLGDMLQTMNSLLLNDILDEQFITLLFVVVDPRQMSLSYSSAGHIGYLLNRNAHIKYQLDINGLPLGLHADARYPVTTLPIEDGDLLVLLTDGIEESMCPRGNQFGRQRVMDFLERANGLPLSQIVHELHAEVHAFQESGEPHDDATSVIARFGKPGPLAEGIRPKPPADCSHTR